MTAENPKIQPLGENALIVEFGNRISENLNRRVLRLALCLEKTRFAGCVEIVPAYASLTVFYDVLKVRKKFGEYPTAFAAVKTIVLNALENAEEIRETKSRLIEIPVSFRREDALDLELVAAMNNTSAENVIEIFTAKTYRVYMLGFLPGFAYMGEVDAAIAAARRPMPRLEIPRGSVGIAGRQTGIYSLASPGGWRIIGRTDVELFTPDKKNLTYLEAGDSVKFFAI